MEVAIVLGTIVNVVCLVLCPIIAGHKGRSVVGWIFGGLFLSLIGLIIVSCLPNISPQTTYQRDNSSQSRPAWMTGDVKAKSISHPMVKSDVFNECPSCFQKVSPKDAICPHCGYRLKKM